MARWFDANALMRRHILKEVYLTTAKRQLHEEKGFHREDTAGK